MKIKFSELLGRKFALCLYFSRYGLQTRRDRRTWVTEPLRFGWICRRRSKATDREVVRILYFTLELPKNYEQNLIFMKIVQILASCISEVEFG